MANATIAQPSPESSVIEALKADLAALARQVKSQGETIASQGKTIAELKERNAVLEAGKVGWWQGNTAIAFVLTALAALAILAYMEITALRAEIAEMKVQLAQLQVQLAQLQENDAEQTRLLQENRELLLQLLQQGR